MALNNFYLLYMVILLIGLTVFTAQTGCELAAWPHPSRRQTRFFK